MDKGKSSASTPLPLSEAKQYRIWYTRLVATTRRKGCSAPFDLHEAYLAALAEVEVGTPEEQLPHLTPASMADQQKCMGYITGLIDDNLLNVIYGVTNPIEACQLLHDHFFPKTGATVGLLHERLFKLRLRYYHPTSELRGELDEIARLLEEQGRPMDDSDKITVLARALVGREWETTVAKILDNLANVEEYTYEDAWRNIRIMEAHVNAMRESRDVRTGRHGGNQRGVGGHRGGGNGGGNGGNDRALLGQQGGGRGGGRGGRGGGGIGRGGRGGATSSNGMRPPPRDPCPNCGQHGHWKRDCPEPLKPLACYVCGSIEHRAVVCPQRK